MKVMIEMVDLALLENNDENLAKNRNLELERQILENNDIN